MKPENVKIKSKIIKRSSYRAPNYYQYKWTLYLLHTADVWKKKISVLKLTQSVVSILLRHSLTEEHKFRSCSVIPSGIQAKRQLGKGGLRQGSQESAEATAVAYAPLVTEPHCHYAICTTFGLDTS